MGGNVSTENGHMHIYTIGSAENICGRIHTKSGHSPDLWGGEPGG